MSTSKRVKHQDCNDQELLDLYAQSGDRQAVAELYERYRGSVGNYLYREINNKEVVTDIFNTIMLELVSTSSLKVYGRSVSVQLFAMAYAQRREHLIGVNNKNTIQTARTSYQDKNRLKRMLASLPRLHRDIIELVYKYNFTIDETADIMGRTVSVVRNCLAHIRNQHLSLLGVSNPSVVAIEDYRSSVKARC